MKKSGGTLYAPLFRFMMAVSWRAFNVLQLRGRDLEEGMRMAVVYIELVNEVKKNEGVLCMSHHVRISLPPSWLSPHIRCIFDLWWSWGMTRHRVVASWLSIHYECL